jgi:hypothetical protein
MAGIWEGRRELAVVYTIAVAAALAVALATNARAAPATLCVKATKTETKPKHYTGGWTDKHCTAVSGTHEGKYEKLADFSESEEAQLKALLKYVQVQSSGVGGKPTVQFSGANVQVVNGEGETGSTNGEGNLVIGYDEEGFCYNPFRLPKHATNANDCANIGGSWMVTAGQTGSHNLVLGEGQTFTSYGGIVAGYGNAISDPFASVTGGFANKAEGEYSSIGGGFGNNVFSEGVFGDEGRNASIFGGKKEKTATDFAASP